MLHVLTLFLILAPLVHSLPLHARAGPSGSLNTPQGGFSLTSVGGAGIIPISYNQVHQPNNHVQTIGIDIALEPYNGNLNPPWQLALGLASDTQTTPIKGNFATLSSCGEYSAPSPDLTFSSQLTDFTLSIFTGVVITEHQIVNNFPVVFRAAAPNININCVRLG